jgi:hypothetical protein
MKDSAFDSAELVVRRTLRSFDQKKSVALKFRGYSSDCQNQKYEAISGGFVAEQTEFEPTHGLYMHRF